VNIHNFSDSLKQSHEAEDLPLWGEIYKQAFPSMVAMLNHRADGQHQRNGIDRSIILDNSKQILIDEKVRWVNKITGLVYEDIALEYLSDSEMGVSGWVCKPLLANYIAYAILPIGKCYLMPVIQLQKAWQENNELWFGEFKTIEAKNSQGGRVWKTLSLCVPVRVLFSAMGKCLRIEFTPHG
tara:strand:+ start:795 stop:1343 length:549 start_codon:yes stop_codon:yes gene_type:complete